MFFKSRTPITSEIIKKKLDTVKNTANEADFFSVNMIQDIRIHDNNITLILEAASSHIQKHGKQIQALCTHALKELSPKANIQIILTNDNSNNTVTTQTPPKTTEEPKKAAHFSTTPIEHVSRVIMVASGKGGVGKSTTTIALAYAFKALGLRVGVLDADIYGPSIPRMTGLQGKPDYHNNLMQPHIHNNIAFMSLGFLIGNEAAILRGPMMTKALNQMLRGTQWGTQEAPLDILLIDTPPGTGDIAISLAQMLPFAYNGGGAVVVTTPQEVALDDVRRCIDSLEKLSVPLLGIIENMSYFEDPTGQKHYLFGMGGGEKLAHEHNAPLLASIPMLPTMREALDKGETPEISHYLDIAKKLNG
jgi:ATP-binding protein involved in chromosome partitioning